jgi:hypothetical protein
MTVPVYVFMSPNESEKQGLKLGLFCVVCYQRVEDLDTESKSRIPERALRTISKYTLLKESCRAAPEPVCTNSECIAWR